MPPADWTTDVLKTLQAPVTPGNLRLLRTWQRWEGGHTKNSATYNWLNTTRGKQFPSMNSVGVRQFPDYRTGVAYTADTILGGYPGIVNALRTGKPYSPKSHEVLLADFSKWVSGSRTARLDYGQKILGVKNVPGISTPPGVRNLASVSTPKQAMSRNELDLDSLFAVLDDGDDFWDLIAMAPEDAPEMAQPAVPLHPKSQPGFQDDGETPALSGKGFQTPLSWSGTHVTDGLGWGTKTAKDFILPAGTILKTPESGEVISWHPTGAQGGGSMEFRGDSGKVYWWGHIDKGMPAGKRLRKGQRYAVVSSDHAVPHLHADVR